MLCNGLGPWRSRFIYSLNMQFAITLTLDHKVKTVWCVNIFTRYKYDRPARKVTLH